MTSGAAPRGAEKCPTCDSPEPRLHPAVQLGGEVQPCRDSWHRGAEKLSDEELTRHRANAVSLAAVYPHYAPHHERSIAIADELRALREKARLLPEMVEALRECLEDLRGEYEGKWFCRGCGERDAQHSPDCRYLQFHALLQRYEEGS